MINTATNTVITNVNVAIDESSDVIAIAPDSEYVYVADGNNSVSVISTSTLTAAFVFSTVDWSIVVIVVIIALLFIILAWYRRRHKSIEAK